LELALKLLFSFGGFILSAACQIKAVQGVSMKKTAFFALVASMVFTASCVAVNVTRLGAGPALPQIPADQVAVYRTADQVPGKYEEVALLNGRGDSMWTSESGMFRRMKKKAGRLGANAIILDALSEPTAAAKIAGAVLGVGVERKGRAIAIFVYPPEKQ